MTNESTHTLGPRGPWQINQSQIMYRDPWIRLVRDDVTRPDGQAGSYCVAYLKSGVSVVAVDQQQNVYLTREFHYGVDRITIELVSGGRDHNEPPIDAARRELSEELGIQAGRWIDLGTTDPFTANVVSPTQLYLALDLSFGTPQTEGTEEIDLVKLSWAEAIEKVYSGEISHAPSGLCLLKADAHFRGATSFPEVQ